MKDKLILKNTDWKEVINIIEKFYYEQSWKKGNRDCPKGNKE